MKRILTFLPALVLATAFLACGGKAPAQPQTAAAGPSDLERLPQPERLVAIGDVHGSLWALEQALRLAGAIDARDHWVGGKLVVVITGDFLDRGDDEIAIMNLLDALRKEAPAAGGALHVLNGNHEAANAAGIFMEVTEKGYAAFKGEVPPAALEHPDVQRHPVEHRPRAAAFRPGGPRARWLARLPFVLIIGDTVFVHGGLLPEHARYGAGRINRELKEWLLGNVAEKPEALIGRGGPLWARDYSQDVDEEDCRRLEEALNLLGVSRMVVGHTIQEHVNPACGEKVWRVDTGMNPLEYKGPIEVLEIRGDAVTPITKSGRVAPLRRHTYEDYSYDGPDSAKARVAEAERRKLDEVKGLFQAAGVAFPPARMLLRGFKAEKEVEVWASSGPSEAMTEIARYEVCYMSGGLGPKRRQGDMQVPEGFYILDMFNSHSAFYLSMRVSYPNQSDKILGHKPDLGSAIMIHGSCVSIGCLAMSDERIQELWIMTKAVNDKGQKVHVHLFPSRDMDALIPAQPNLAVRAFWENIRQGLEAFEADHRLPAYSVDKQGKYVFK